MSAMLKFYGWASKLWRRVKSSGANVRITPGSGGTVIVAQPGGVAGTDEGQISHTGSLLEIASMDGRINLTPSTSARGSYIGGVGGVSFGGLFSQASDAGFGYDTANLFIGDKTANLQQVYTGHLTLGVQSPVGGGTSFAGLNYSASGIVLLTDGTAGHNALKLNTSGLISGNAVSPVATTNRVRVSNVSTLTTATHNLVAGQIVTVSGMTDTTFNGTFVVATVPSATTFTYANTGSDVGSGADVGGTVTPNAVLQLGTAPSADMAGTLATTQSGGAIASASLDTITGTNASGVEGVKISPTATGGLKTVVVDKTVSPSAIETAVFTVPKGSVIKSVQGNVQSALTGGGTTVTWSLGTAGDPDKYGTAGSPTPANALTQNSKSSFLPDRVQLTADEPVVLTGAATGGTADGDTALTVGSVRVVLVYETYESLANA